jgi:pyruvate dehydrogenase E2 component (dihydrolipoyllysine-residue acetyltransferase)
MIVDIVLPKLGMYEGDATLVEWLVADGAVVAAGDPLLVVETEKLESEIEADDPGIVVHVESAGFQAPIGTLVGYVVSSTDERDQVRSQR